MDLLTLVSTSDHKYESGIEIEENNFEVNEEVRNRGSTSFFSTRKISRTYSVNLRFLGWNMKKKD